MRYGKLQNGTRNAERSTRCLVFSTQYSVLGTPSSASNPPSHFRLPPSPRRAVTLIEMLIVLFIISLLAVAALRALPGDDQKPREAARMLNVYFATAKANAAATGRPAGVILRPSSTTTYAAYTTLLEQSEVPPTYAGDTLNAMVRAQDWTYKSDGLNYYTNLATVVKILVKQNDFSNLIRRGDQIQLNAQGPIYTIGYDNPSLRNTGGAAPPATLPDIPLDANNNYLDFNNASITTDGLGWITSHCITLFLDLNMSLPMPWPKSYDGVLSDPIIFKIIRQPEKSAIAPLQLPSGAGIDLPFSGVDCTYGVDGASLVFGSSSFNPFFNVYPTGTAILFSPSGSVDSINIGGTVLKPTQTIYLLVGKTTVCQVDQATHALDTVNSEPDLNWFDLKNIIVSINPLTGTVSTNPVYPPYYNEKNPGPPFASDPPSNLPNQFDPAKTPKWDTTKRLDDPANANFVQALFYSRKFAREAQTMGGKR